jgi:hypothetical protein
MVPACAVPQAGGMDHDTTDTTETTADADRPGS